MADARAHATTIDEYIERFPDKVRDKLESLRRTIRKAAPEATEAIRFGVPSFELKGRLVHFGAFGDHVDVYPVPPNAGAFSSELAGYRRGKASARFPLDRPLPLDLISRIVKFRVAENLDRAFSRQRFGS